MKAGSHSFAKADLGLFAYVGSEYVSKPKAVVLTFPGLGSSQMRDSLEPQDVELAAQGALFVFPYVGPWSWMNEGTVDFVDLVMDRVESSFRAKGLPLIARGGSMGGYSALAYSMFSRKKLAACLANCPVCDLLLHYSERPDLPRTFHACYEDYSDIRRILKDRSPVHRPELLPDIEYLIIHGMKDDRVSKALHSDPLVKRMRKRRLRVNYVEDERMCHCNPCSYETVVAMRSFISSFLK